MQKKDPNSVHRDARYRTVESLEDWDVRTVPASDPSYEEFFRADCLPVQLLHRPTGLSILTATRRTCGRFEALIPKSLPAKSLGDCCQRKRPLIALRSDCYEDIRHVVETEFGVIAPQEHAFQGYALMDRPGPKEFAGADAS